MLQLMKRDYHINAFYFLMVFLATPFIYLFNLSPIFIYLGVIIGCIFNLFYYDGHNHVNRFIVSLPVHRGTAVFSRYVFMVGVMVIYLFYIWLIDMIAHALPPVNWLPASDFNPITGVTILLTFLGIILIAAISIPIYYFFQSFIKSLIAQGVLLFGGIILITLMGYLLGDLLNLIPEKYALTVFHVIENQFVVFILGFAIICLFVSYKISARIYSKRDIV